jgi:hypothetical protein
MFVNHKQKKVPPHHLWSTDQPSLSIILLSLLSCTMAKKGKGDFKFTIAELEHLLDVINKIAPIGNPDWEKVHYLSHDKQTPESLKHKFQELVCKKNPIGDPNCPPHICEAKQSSRTIVIATIRSTGGSDGKVESIASY